MVNSLSPADASLGELSFEAALAELEAIVAAMDNGQLALEESLAAYRRGAALLQRCRGLLADAEEKVRVIDESGMRLLSEAR